MDTVSYSTEEKIRLLRANGYVVREESVANSPKESFAFKAGRKYNINPVFDSTVKSILLIVNPGGGGGEEEEPGGFYTEGVGINITGPVISLSYLGLENLVAPGEDKILFYDYSAGALDWANFAETTSTFKVSSNDTTPGYLEDKLALSYGGNVSEILELSTISEGANEVRILQLDETKISHDNIADVSADDHHSEIHILATTGPHTDSLPLTDLAPGTAGDIITRQATDWAVLAKGTEDYVLKMGATYPAWGTVDWSELTGTQPAPVAHNHAWSDITSGIPTTFGGYGISDTLVNLNTVLSDATLYKWEADQGAVNIHGDNVVYGSAVSTACVGNDARLSDARTPTAHAMDSATYHTSSDITVLNATTSKHGFLPKLGGGTTNYLRADGTWVAPPGSGMVYPGAGIALSTGSAWGTSITNNSANWNTAYSHSQSSSQAHSDYLRNNVDDTTSGILTASAFRALSDANYSLLMRSGGNNALYVQQVDATGEIASFRYGSATVGQGTEVMAIDYNNVVINIPLTVTNNIYANYGGFGVSENADGVYVKAVNTNTGITAAARIIVQSYNNNIQIASYGENHSVYPAENHIYTGYVGGKVNIGSFGVRGVLFTDGGSVELYHNNLKRFETTAAGVTVTGIATATGAVKGNTYFYSTDTVAVFGTTGAGTVVLRPTNWDSATAQSTFTTALATIGTSLTVNGSAVDFYGAAAMSVNIEANAGHTILNLDAGGGAYDIRIQYQDDGANKWLQKWANNNDSMFFYNYALGANVMTMLASGNVGIGTTPSYKLDVNGTGRYTGVLIANGIAPTAACTTYSGFSRVGAHGSNALYFQKLGNTSGEDMIARFAYGNVTVNQGTMGVQISSYGIKAYYEGALKLETLTTGILVTGRVQATDYYSYDGTPGVTTTVDVVGTFCNDSGTLKQRTRTITIKNGLITSIGTLGDAQTVPICPV